MKCLGAALLLLTALSSVAVADELAWGLNVDNPKGVILGLGYGGEFSQVTATCASGGGELTINLSLSKAELSLVGNLVAQEQALWTELSSGPVKADVGYPNLVQDEGYGSGWKLAVTTQMDQSIAALMREIARTGQIALQGDGRRGKGAEKIKISYKAAQGKSEALNFVERCLARR